METSNDASEEKPQQNKFSWLGIVLLIIFGLINTIISPYLYTIILSLMFSGEEMIFLFLGPVSILGVTLPFFYIIFILIETLIVSLVMLKIFNFSKKINFTKNKLLLYFITLAIFLILQLLGQVIPGKVVEIQSNNKNPIQAGTKNYDFSDKVEINNRKSVKTDLAIKNNRVIWTEQTKSFPNFSNNVWDVFLFKFSSEQDQGSVLKVSDFGKAKEKAPKFGPTKNTYLDEQVYWIQDNSLYVYNEQNLKPEILADNVDVVYGKHKNSLLIKKASDSDNKNLFFIDLTTKEFTEFPFSEYYVDNSFSFLTMNGSAFCYTTGTNYYVPGYYTVGRYNIETGMNASFQVTRESEKYFPPIITDCQNDFVVFNQNIKSKLAPYHENDLTYKVYNFDSNKYTLEKTMPAENFQSRYANAKIYNNKLYYTNSVAKTWDDNYNLMSEDLTTGKVTIVIPNVSIWDMNEDYVVYGLKTPESEGYTEKISLQKILK